MATHHPIRKTVTPSAPEIPDKLYFRIGDVARLCQVPAYVLRFWETEFPQLKPNKGGTGQRLYRKKDVEMALRIKSLLYDQGYTIPGARQVFKTEARPKDLSPFAAPDSTPAQPGAPGPDSRTREQEPNIASISTLRRDAQLQTVRDDMRSLLAMLSKPASSAHPAAEGKVKPMRPRLVLEPKPDPRKNQGALSLFGDE
jgi:DNA-binding transcriptional MerR regulator